MKETLVPAAEQKRTFFRTEFQKWLAASISFSVILMTVRIIFSGNLGYSFLIWNLFLAFIPFAISNWLSKNAHLAGSKLSFSLVFIAWLLFIPNSFYILTDLFHLNTFISMPLWFDLTMILSFAWNGMLLGVLSVQQMEKLIERYIRRKTGLFFIYPVMFLNALGIYIGRYLRFNSWDVITNPFHLIEEIFNLALHPVEYKYVWSMVICFSVFMTLLYLTLINRHELTAAERNRR